jgi:hypothetical protein
MQKIDELFDLTGKTAVVTGASYGLGVTFSHALAQQGVNLILAARSAEKLNEVAASLAQLGHSVLVAPCDVGDAKQVTSMMERAVERFGRVDVVVNNAGVVAEAGMLPERVPDTAFEQTVRVERNRELSAFLSGDQGGGHQFDAEPGGELGRPRRASERARARLVSQRDDCRRVFHSSISRMGEKDGPNGPNWTPR